MCFHKALLCPALPSLLLIEYGNEFCGDDWLCLPKLNMTGLTDDDLNIEILSVTTPYGGNQAKCYCLFVHMCVRVQKCSFFSILCILE